MGKKSINKKEVQEFITLGRLSGKTEQEIYYELSQEYFDKKSIALLITGTVTEKNKSKYQIYNNVLIGILGFSALSNMLFVANLAQDAKSPWLLIFVFLAPLFSIIFIYQMIQYNASIYRLCGILTALNFFQTATKLESSTEIIISLVFTAIVVGLSFFLDSKMFPDYSPKNLKKDSNGEYILPQPFSMD